jgi:hypothetical protein
MQPQSDELSLLYWTGSATFYLILFKEQRLASACDLAIAEDRTYGRPTCQGEARWFSEED